MDYENEFNSLQGIETLPTLSQTERLPGMASLAVVKVGLAESALAVVAGHTALSACGWKMLRRKG
jgi:hypothetical protein